MDASLAAALVAVGLMIAFILSRDVDIMNKLEEMDKKLTTLLADGLDDEDEDEDEGYPDLYAGMPWLNRWEEVD